MNSGGHHVQLPLLKLGPVEQAAQELVQMSFEISKDGDSTAFLGNQCQHSVTLIISKFILIQMGPPVSLQNCIF